MSNLYDKSNGPYLMGIRNPAFCLASSCEDDFYALSERFEGQGYPPDFWVRPENVSYGIGPQLLFNLAVIVPVFRCLTSSIKPINEVFLEGNG